MERAARGRALVVRSWTPPSSCRVKHDPHKLALHVLRTTCRETLRGLGFATEGRLAGPRGDGSLRNDLLMARASAIAYALGIEAAIFSSMRASPLSSA